MAWIFWRGYFASQDILPQVNWLVLGTKLPGRRASGVLCVFNVKNICRLVADLLSPRVRLGHLTQNSSWQGQLTLGGVFWLAMHYPFLCSHEPDGVLPLTLPGAVTLVHPPTEISQGNNTTKSYSVPRKQRTRNA